MNKTTKLYTAVWAIIFAVFNVIVFVVPNPARMLPPFWIGYGFIVAAFFAHWICARRAFKDDDDRKLFYNIPAVLVSCTGLGGMLITGGLGMLITGFPWWLSVLLCLLTMGATALAVLGVSAAGRIVSDTDKKVKTATHTFRTITADADHLRMEARSDALKALTGKVYEAIRYSDVMSKPALYEINERIILQFEAFADAVREEDIELSEELARELLNLVDERNKKCKLLK